MRRHDVPLGDLRVVETDGVDADRSRAVEGSDPTHHRVEIVVHR